MSVAVRTAFLPTSAEIACLRTHKALGAHSTDMRPCRIGRGLRCGRSCQRRRFRSAPRWTGSRLRCGQSLSLRLLVEREERRVERRQRLRGRRQASRERRVAEARRGQPGSHGGRRKSSEQQRERSLTEVDDKGGRCELASSAARGQSRCEPLGGAVRPLQALVVRGAEVVRGCRLEWRQFSLQALVSLGRTGSKAQTRRSRWSPHPDPSRRRLA